MRTSSKEAQLAPLHSLLRARFVATVVLAESPESRLTDLAASAGLSVDSVVMALERPLGLAAMSYDHVASLAAVLDASINISHLIATQELRPAERLALIAAKQLHSWTDIETVLLAEFSRVAISATLGAQRFLLTTADDWERLYELWRQRSQE